jgi:hypothetical protein
MPTRGPDAVPPQVAADLATAVALITDEPLGPPARPPAPARAFDGAGLHERLEHTLLMAFPGRQQHGQGLTAALGLDVELGAEAAPAASERLLCRPSFVTSGSSRVLVGADDGAIHEVRRPVEPAPRIGPLLERRKQGVPDTGMDPAIELGGDRLPRAVVLWQVTPLGAGRMDLEHAVGQAAAVARSRSAARLGQQRLQPRPLLVSEVVSVSHPYSV